MKINKKYLILVLLLVILGLGIKKLKVNSVSSPVQNERVIQTYEASIVINDLKNAQSFDVSQNIGSTVLAATESVLNGNVTMNGSGEKAFITGLNGRIADPKKHEFWELNVNGKQAEVGAGSLVIKNNDKIEWRISTY